MEHGIVPDYSSMEAADTARRRALEAPNDSAHTSIYKPKRDMT